MKRKVAEEIEQRNSESSSMRSSLVDEGIGLRGSGRWIAGWIFGRCHYNR
jgi:hypothetical protein